MEQSASIVPVRNRRNENMFMRFSVAMHLDTEKRRCEADGKALSVIGINLPLAQIVSQPG